MTDAKHNLQWLYTQCVTATWHGHIDEAFKELKKEMREMILKEIFSDCRIADRCAKLKIECLALEKMKEFFGVDGEEGD